MSKHRIHYSTPDDKWHLAVRSPEGYGFNISFDTEWDFLEAIDAIQRTACEEEGLAAHLRAIPDIILSDEEKAS